MDVQKLLDSLENENNEKLLSFTSKKIVEMNQKVLQELHLTKEETMNLLQKLKNYKYVDEMNDLNYGTFLRWIPLTNPERIELTKGAIFCELKITDDGLRLVCKNHSFPPRHFQINMDENLIFQKLMDQELVLLSALDYLAK
jgi:hypothetical protein